MLTTYKRKERERKMRKTYYFDMDGVIANFHKEPYNYKNAISREWIANLEPFMDNVTVVRNLIAQGNNVYILSKAAKETSKQGKIEWLARYIPELVEENIIIIVGNGKKVDYMREEGILIDDDMKNVRPWIKAGHEAIYLEVKGMRISL
jgi:5'(3')-deoxyribonucleotidase